LRVFLCLKISSKVVSNPLIIFDYAIEHDHTEHDPAKPVRAQIPTQKPKHRVSIISPKEFGRLLRCIDSYQGTFDVQMALKIPPILFQRPNEIRQMLWADLNLESAEWRPFVCKTSFHHIVPLSKQALNILNQIKPLSGKQ
jgi:integrase